MKKLLLLVLLFACVQTAMSQIVINEICAANADLIYDPEHINFSAWVELYNAGNQDVDLNGYYISDKADIPLRYRIPNSAVIPAKGYLLIWCDNENHDLHTNFSLDSDGEEVILSNAAGEQIDKIIFPKQYLNTSYGRAQDGDNSWNYLIYATPGVANKPNTATAPLAKPRFSVERGRYASPQSVAISHDVAGVEIRYTLDGSEPNENSALYESPVTIDKTSTLKARAFHASNLPSRAQVHSYFINERESTLPVFSLSTNPAYLNDNTIGIYVVGTNGIAGNGITYAANWNRNWWRHFDLEYFSPDGTLEFGESVDIRISGNYSRRRPQKTFAVKVRDKYSKSMLDHRLFPNKQYKEFGGFLLRNSGNDWDLTMFRDGFMQNLLVGQMDIDYQDYKPSIIYLNGQYWGILNLRERIDADYFESNYGLKEIDLLEGGGTVIEGSNERYATYMDSLRRINITDPLSISFIERYIDVQEFINYKVANIYYGNVDWPANNVTFWRPRTADGKFRWVLWDTDYGFQLSDAHSTSTHPTLEWATAPDNVDGLNREWSTRHFRTVLRNPVFRNRFIQTMTTAIQTTFDPARVKGKIEEFKQNIAAEMPHHVERWSNPAQWDQEVAKLTRFADERNPYMLQHVAEFFGLGDQIKIHLETANNSGGRIKLNGVLTNENKEYTYFKNLPFTVEAVSLPGYQFKEWTLTGKHYERKEIIQKETNWKYLDQGFQPAAEWKTLTFDDATWLEGPGQLGYGEGDEKTIVSFGPDRNNKYTTTYFRRTFDLTSLDKLEDFAGHVIFDDGVAVYVNGTEVYRNNLPGGELTYNTFALRSYSPENVYHYFEIPKELFIQGTNIIAVEVHQNDLISSDLSFDFYLEATEVGEEETINSSSVSQSGIAYGDVKITAMFEELPIITSVVINEFCATQSDLRDDHNEVEDWIELHNTGETAVDIGGLYITDNLNNKRKHQIPTGSPTTVIPPGGYLILWADEQSKQGVTHLNFKLSSNGESIGLYQEKGTELITIDEVIFGPSDDFESFSRIPNATGPFVLTSTMSPGEENPLVSAVVAEKLMSGLYPNPASDFVNLRLYRPVTTLMVMDIHGRTITRIAPDSEEQILDISGLLSGVYVVKAFADGHEQTIRFIKR